MGKILLKPSSKLLVLINILTRNYFKHIRDSRKGPTMNLKIPVSIEDLYNGTTVKALF